MRGIFISFEGIDGCGKTTQISLLQKALEEMGFHVISTHEPGGSPFGSTLRSLLLNPETQHNVQSSAFSSTKADALTEIFLFMADRHHHVTSLIRPALEKGSIVISDRFADSTLIYQGFDQGFNKDTIMMLNQLAVQNVWPACTFILDISPEESLKRLKSKKHEFNQKDRFEAVDTSSVIRRRNGYRTLSAEFPERICLINGEQPQETIHEEIIKAIDSRLKKTLEEKTGNV